VVCARGPAVSDTRSTSGSTMSGPGAAGRPGAAAVPFSPVAPGPLQDASYVTPQHFTLKRNEGTSCASPRHTMAFSSRFYNVVASKMLAPSQVGT